MEHKQLNLIELISAIEDELQNPQQEEKHLSKRQPLQQALETYSGDMKELQPFVFFDEKKNYTRNLIATDDDKYALMLLCWNRLKFSPIHDHPCDGCFVKVIQGRIQEVRYKKHNHQLLETQNEVLDHGVSYMHDSLGLHKIGNPDPQVNAITLHLYAPCFHKCSIWLDPQHADKSSQIVTSYYSEYGCKNVY